MLTLLQKNVLLYLAEQTLQAQKRFHGGETMADQQKVVAGYAYALYTDLVTAGSTIEFSDTMLGNRGVPPTDPEFFNSIHALQAFIGFVNVIDQQ